MSWKWKSEKKLIEDKMDWKINFISKAEILFKNMKIWEAIYEVLLEEYPSDHTLETRLHEIKNIIVRLNELNNLMFKSETAFKNILNEIAKLRVVFKEFIHVVRHLNDILIKFCSKKKCIYI